MRKHKSDMYGGWLKTEIEVFVTYHDHKETMAWTATALFLAAAVAFLSTIPRIAAEHQCAATVVIVLAWLAIAGFVNMQFRGRWSAADTCDGLRAALTKIYAGGYLNVAVSTDDTVPGFPIFVAKEIASASKRKRRWRCDFYRDSRWQSELASYFLLVLACVGMLMAVWNPPPKEESKVEGIGRQLAEASAKVETLSHELIVRLAESEDRLRAHIEESDKSHNNQIQRMAPCKPERRR